MSTISLSAAVHVVTVEMQSSKNTMHALVHVHDRDTCMTLLRSLLKQVLQTSSFLGMDWSYCLVKKHWSRFWLSLLRTTALKDSKQSRDSISWCLEPCTLVGWTVKISRHSQAHAWDLTPDVPQSLNIYFLVTLFYPPFALLWWIEVKTTAGKNLFSIHHRGSG